jgi:protein SCO1/2
MLSFTSCDKQKEETAYICPMKCEESESQKAGTCPVCKMDLVLYSEVRKMEKKQEGNSEEKPSEKSLYSLTSYWKNQDGKDIQLKYFQGKTQIVAMIFTTCEYACPRMITDMKAVEEKVLEEKREDINFLLISIDPDTDKPSRLKTYAEQMDLDLNKWSLLHGKEGNIKEVASMLGFKYNKFYNGSFSHSNLMTALNSEGEIIFQQEGLELAPENMLKAIK